MICPHARQSQTLSEYPVFTLTTRILFCAGCFLHAWHISVFPVAIFFVKLPTIPLLSIAAPILLPLAFLPRVLLVGVPFGTVQTKCLRCRPASASHSSGVRLLKDNFALHCKFCTVRRIYEFLLAVQCFSPVSPVWLWDICPKTNKPVCLPSLVLLSPAALVCIAGSQDFLY